MLPGTGEERTAETERERKGGRKGGSWTLCRSLLLRHGASCTSSDVYICVCVSPDTSIDGKRQEHLLVFAARQLQTLLNRDISICEKNNTDA